MSRFQTWGEWLQSDFHQLAAFFSDVRSSGLGIQNIDRDYEFTYLGRDEEEIVGPKVPSNTHLVGDAQSKRLKLSQWVTHPGNKLFSRTVVNRIWALMFGRPLVQPIDDIPFTSRTRPVWNCCLKIFSQRLRPSTIDQTDRHDPHFPIGQSSQS